MNLRSTGLILALGIMIGGQLGCTLGYSGTRVREDRRGAAKYHRYRTQHRGGLNQAAAEPQVPSGRIRLGGSGLQNRMAPVRSDRLMRKPITADHSDASPARTTKFFDGQLGDLKQNNARPMDGVGNLQQITFGTAGADFDPALDRSGRWLAYCSTRHRPTSDLYVQAVDGTAIRRLTDDLADDAAPAFSPDGKWIVYCSKRAGNWDLYRINANGGSAQQLTHSLADDIYPSFSPHGNQIVYCTPGAISGQWELALIDVDRPSAPKIIGHGLFPQWSPVENRIVYQRPRTRGSRHFGVWLIELKDGQWGGATQIAASTNAAVITPRWSPDGKSIVFCTIVNPESDLQQGTPVQSDIWVHGLDGMGRANLTRSRFANLQPVWGPNGLVYFVSNRGRNGMENIWAMRTEAVLKVARSVFGAAASKLPAEASTQ